MNGDSRLKQFPHLPAENAAELAEFRDDYADQKDERHLADSLLENARQAERLAAFNYLEVPSLENANKLSDAIASHEQAKLLK